MKKMMAGLVTLSLVVAQMPAMAFAASAEFEATAKVVGLWKVGADFTVNDVEGEISGDDVPELQLTVTDAAYLSSATNPENVFELKLGNATWLSEDADDLANNIYVDSNNSVTVSVDDIDDDECEVTITGRLEEGDKISIVLESVMDVTSKGKMATVTVTSDAFSAKDLAYCATMSSGVEISIKDTVKVAQGETVTLDDKGITITPIFDDMYSTDVRFNLDLSKGFEFSEKNTILTVMDADGNETTLLKSLGQIEIDGDEIVIFPGISGEVTILGLMITATTAEIGDVATISLSIYDTSGGTAYHSVVLDASVPSVSEEVVEPEVEVTVEDILTKTIAIIIGAEEMTVNGEAIVLPAPAYITDAGYTMLPVSAVASALGIEAEAIVWDGETRTVTITYGEKVISMTIGNDVMLVDGEEMAASSAPEITNDRTFLPIRDLANALGITDISWDGETQTATLVMGSVDDVETTEA